MENVKIIPNDAMKAPAPNHTFEKTKAYQEEDAGKSGKSIEGRPAFKQMLNDIENGLSIDYVLVYKLSRFGRNAADILNSLEHIQSFGVNLICIEEGIDSSQTSGKLLISVLSAVAEIERENIIEQTMNGRKEKARQGGLPENTRFRERKLHDMTLRLDGLYDVIVELEEKIEDVKLRRKAVEQDAITLENIYTLLANFEKVYDKISDEERKSLISSLIKEIEIFPCDESVHFIRFSSV